MMAWPRGLQCRSSRLGVTAFGASARNWPRLSMRVKPSRRDAGILEMRVAGTILILSLTTLPCAGMEISRVTGCTGGDVLKLRGVYRGR